MAKYHLNPEKGPQPCTATKRPCKYAMAGEEHFDSREAATAAYEKKMTERAQATLTALSKRSPAQATNLANFTPPTRNFSPELQELDDRLETATYEGILAYASESPEAHRQVDALIDARAAFAEENFRRLAACAPKPKTARSLTYTNHKNLMKEHNDYRNHTAFLVEAHLSSPHYQAATHELPAAVRLGGAVEATAYDQNDARWYTTRYDTVGGSDLGALAVKDFEENPVGLDAYSIKKVEASKIYPPDSSRISLTSDRTDAVRRGALYRGTVWEDRIRDKFATDYADQYKVYVPRGQYQVEGKDWYRVNFDGILSDREDGEPNGVLEIKTGGEPSTWADGIPTKYRAQTLYYLNATGYEYAYVRVLLNDNEVRDYKLSADDEVAPGAGVTMREYEPRVKEWFDGLRAQREVEAEAS